MIEKRTVTKDVYVAEDRAFDSVQEAQAYLIKKRIRAIVDKHFYYGISPGEIANHLFDEREALLEALQLEPSVKYS